MHECVKVEQLKAAGVPDEHHEAFKLGLAAGFSFSALLGLYLKYKDQLPLLWQMVQDVLAAFKGSTPAPAPTPEPGPFGP